MFGEMGILDGVPRNATAVAVGAVQVSVTPRHDFLNTLQKDPDLALKVMTKLVERLRLADEKLAERLPADVTSDPVPASVAQMPISEVENSERIGLFGRLFGRSRNDAKASAVSESSFGPLRIFIAGFGKDLPPEASEAVNAIASILGMIPNAIIKRVDENVDWPAEVTDPEAAR